MEMLAGIIMNQLPKMRYAPDLLQDKVALVTGGMDHYSIAPEQWLKLNRNILGRMGYVEDVAAAIILFSSPLAKFFTDEEWCIDGKTLHLAHDARQMIDAVKPARRERCDGKIE
jgi:citronellol/citronellal dehydrogenase